MTPYIHLALEINSHCNRKCSWCPNIFHNRPVEYLELNLIKKILAQCVGIKECTFNNFNEPCLDSRLPDIVKMAHDILGTSCNIYLNTNGDYLTKELYDKLILSGIKNFNISDYDGRSKITWTYVNPLKAMIDNFNNRAGLVLNKNITPLNKSCRYPFQHLVINWQGLAVICCQDFWGEVILGDIRKNTVEEIYNSAIAIFYRNELKENNRTNLKLCCKCDFDGGL